MPRIPSSLIESGATPPFSAPGSVVCPSRWKDLTSTIQVNWIAPQRPNGIVLQYYLVLTNFGGNTVIASTTVNSSDALTTNFANERLGSLDPPKQNHLVYSIALSPL